MPVIGNPMAKIFAQIFLVSFLSVFGTYIAETLQYRGFFNLILLVVLVASISFALNDSILLRVSMFIALGAWSFLLIGITGHVLGYAD